MLLDCEALYGVKQASLYSKNHILFLLFFIASGFIFNTDSNIDESGITEMNLINSMGDAFTIKVLKFCLKNKGKTDKNAFLVESAPKLIWTLRDFSGDKLDPESKKEMSSKEYLDFCLRGKVHLIFFHDLVFE